MSEHGWPDFHDDGAHHEDGGSHHDDLHHEEVGQHDDAHDGVLDHEQDSGYFEDAVHHDLDDGSSPAHEDIGLHETHSSSETAYSEPDHEIVDGHDTIVGHDPDALPEPSGEEVTSFPPILDVGPLPEPVDGFPWIDTGSLGLIDPATLHAAATTEVDPHELAEYAGADLPPGADPWATLADSDDPATSALAKWWSENS